MSWEDKFSTMVKESTAKIDEAKVRILIPWFIEFKVIVFCDHDCVQASQFV